MKYAGGWHIEGPILVPARAGWGALPGSVAELLMEAAQRECYRLATGVSAAALTSATPITSGRCWGGNC